MAVLDPVVSPLAGLRALVAGIPGYQDLPEMLRLPVEAISAGASHADTAGAAAVAAAGRELDGLLVEFADLLHPVEVRLARAALSVRDAVDGAA